MTHPTPPENPSQSVATPAQSTKPDPHSVVFTGRGGEYFRVWIVNVLLTLITLGFYTPFARRRTMQYFYSHTLVAGSPLEFSASQRKMFFGFLLLTALYVIFHLAQTTGQDWAIALFIFGGAALMPFFWASAMRFRLRATRWRGVRLSFAARWREIYAASWPVFVMAAIWIAAFIGVIALTGEDLGNLQELADTADEAIEPLDILVNLLLIGIPLIGIFSMLCLIRLDFNYRRLLVRRAHVGKQSGYWKPSYSAFIRIWLLTFCLALASLVALGVVVGILFAVGFSLWNARAGLWQQALWILLLGLSGFLFMTVFSAPARAYREARVFQLVWDQIGLSHIARTRCTLNVWGYVRLRMKNVLFTLLTLGFYRPFARVSEYQRKAESVTLYVRGGIDQLEGQLVKETGSLGDAVADAVGLDIIG